MSDYSPAQPTGSQWPHPNGSGAPPMGIEQLDILLRLIAAAKERVKSFACVGADLAILAGAIAEEHSNSRGLLIDASAGNPGAGQRQLSIQDPDISVARLDQAGADCAAILARFAPLDAVILGSELRINQRERRTLLSDILRLLNPGGILLSVGDVSSFVRWTGSPLENYIITTLSGNHLHEDPAHSTSREGGDDEVRALLEVQCDWMREAGFESVGCYMKTADLTVFGGQCPEISHE